jgi:predicted RNase H-like HicB family nuclease
VVRQFKIVVEKHPDAYVAYPLGTKGVVAGEGQTYEEALTDARSAIAFHLQSFGADAQEPETPVLEKFLAEAEMAEIFANEKLVARLRTGSGQARARQGRLVE